MRIHSLVPGPQLGLLQTVLSKVSQYHKINDRIITFVHPRNLSIPKATSAKRVSQILLAVEYLEGKLTIYMIIISTLLQGLDNPVLKWSLPDNSHVCLVSESGDNESPDRDHVSRDMAVSVNIAQFFSVFLLRISIIAR